MDAVMIRELADLDLSEAIRLIVDSFTVEGHTPSQYSIQRVRERLVASYEQNDYAPRFIISELEGRIVGIAGFGKLEIASRTWGLFLSSVHRDFRSQGIGTCRAGAPNRRKRAERADNRQHEAQEAIRTMWLQVS